jgi:peptidyl-prolyl cis-trans isomerase D
VLTKIREKATGVFAWIIVIIISIPFALWGVNSYFEGGGQSVVATVEGVDIDLNTFQRAMSERRRVMAQVLQQNVGSEFFQSDTFRRQVLEGLLQNAAESSYAERRGYGVSDAILGQSIRELPYFQVDGQFDSQRYQDLVANAGMGIGQFEQQQRQELISDQIQSAFMASGFISDSDLDRTVSLLEQVRTIDHAVISANDPGLGAEVTDEMVREYFEANRDEFFAPDQMRVSYVVLSVDDVATAIEIDEEEARRYYQANETRFGEPEQRRVSHVLIALDADASEEADSAALETATEIAGRARAGEGFSELARQFSDDSGSAARGGDLGMLNRGSMVKPFEDAAFSLSSVGDVTDPVRSRFGYHVITLTEHRPADIRPFEQVRAEIEQELKRQVAESRYLEAAETFANVVYEQPESLIPAADDLQVEIQASDWFSRDVGEGIASNPRFRRAAFNDEVRLDGLNSEAFELDSNTMVALRQLESRERRQLTLEEAQDDIRALLMQSTRTEAARSLGESLVSDLRSGADWQVLMDEQGLVSDEFEGTRDDAFDQTGRELVREVFGLPAPLPGSPTLGGFTTMDGNYVIYRLTGVEEANPSEVDPERREAIRNVLLRRHSEELYLSFQEALRKQADIEVFEDRFESQEMN